MFAPSPFVFRVSLSILGVTCYRIRRVSPVDIRNKCVIASGVPGT